MVTAADAEHARTEPEEQRDHGTEDQPIRCESLSVTNWAK